MMHDTDTTHGFRSLKEGSTDSTAIKSYYDEWAETYDATLSSWNYQAPEDAADALCKHLKPGANVLDVGCGTGLFGQAMSGRLDCVIEGIDISAGSLEITKGKGGYGRLHCHDLQVTPLPVPDDGFDAVACVGVMTYIKDEPSLLADLCRVVRPGGYILFTQRDDLWAERNFDSILEDFEHRKLWTPLKISQAKPYLPENDDFSDRIRVIQVICRVM